MDNLIEKRWNTADMPANFSSFLIDKMHFELDPARDPYENLCQIFQRLRLDRDNDAEFQES